MSAFRMSSMLRVAARVPGIKFPTRRLPDGTRVSDLPAGTRWSTRALQISSEIRENAKPTTSRSLTFSLPHLAFGERPPVAEAKAFIENTAAASGAQGTRTSTGFAVSRPRPPPIPYPRPDPPRAPLSELEMETVMLGGAHD